MRESCIKEEMRKASVRKESIMEAFISEGVRKRLGEKESGALSLPEGRKICVREVLESDVREKFMKEARGLGDYG